MHRPSHPLHIAAGQVVVHRDDVNALALDRIEVRRQRSDERLTFARHHFRDVAFVQDHAAEHLHIVMPQAQETTSTLATNRERFDENILQRFASFQPAAKVDSLVAQLFVGHRLILRLKRTNRVDLGLQSLEESRVGGAKHTGHTFFKAAENGVADTGDDFPDTFKNFHDELYERGGA